MNRELEHSNVETEKLITKNNQVPHLIASSKLDNLMTHQVEIESLGNISSGAESINHNDSDSKRFMTLIWNESKDSTKIISNGCPQSNDEISKEFIDSAIRLLQQISPENSKIKALGSLNYKNFRNFRLKIPSISEQSILVNLLNQIEIVRKKIEQSDRISKNFTCLLFQNMFGSESSTFSKFQQHNLGDLVTLETGKFLPFSNIKESGPFPVKDGSGIIGYHSHFNVDSQAIVIGKQGKFIGNVYITSKKTWITDKAYYASKFESVLNPTYLTEALRMAKLNREVKGGWSPMLTEKMLQNTKILVPDMKYQEKFVGLVSNFNMIVEKLNRSKKLLEELDSILYYKISTGTKVSSPDNFVQI